MPIAVPTPEGVLLTNPPYEMSRRLQDMLVTEHDESASEEEPLPRPD